MTWCLIRPYGHKAHIVKSMYSGDMVTTLCCQWLQKAHVLDVSVAPPNWYQPCKLCRRKETPNDEG